MLEMCCISETYILLGLMEDQHPSIEVDDLTNGPKVKSNKNNLSLKIVKPLIWKSPWYLKPLPLPQAFQAGLVFRVWIFMRRRCAAGFAVQRLTCVTSHVSF